MNLPNCPCRSTVTGLQSMTTESLVLIVQTSVSPTLPAVTYHARRWRRIVLPKLWAFRQSFTAKTEVSGGGVGRKWNLVTWGVEPNRWCNLIPARLTVKKTGWAAIFQASIAGVLAAFRWHDGADMTGVAQASDRYQARPVRWPKSTAGSGSRKWVGSGLKGQFLSLSFSLTCPSFFPLLEICFPLSIYRNQLLLLFFLFAPKLNTN